MAKLLRIVGDGTKTGTHIYDSEGRDLSAELKVRKMTIMQESGGPPIVHIEVVMPCEIDIKAASVTAITIPQYGSALDDTEF